MMLSKLDGGGSSSSAKVAFSFDVVGGVDDGVSLGTEVGLEVGSEVDGLVDL